MKKQWEKWVKLMSKSPSPSLDIDVTFLTETSAYPIELSAERATRLKSVFTHGSCGE